MAFFLASRSAPWYVRKEFLPEQNKIRRVCSLFAVLASCVHTRQRMKHGSMARIAELGRRISNACRRSVMRHVSLWTVTCGLHSLTLAVPKDV